LLNRVREKFHLPTAADRARTSDFPTLGAVADYVLAAHVQPIS
jgi:hypothetical protein